MNSNSLEDIKSKATIHITGYSNSIIRLHTFGNFAVLYVDFWGRSTPLPANTWYDIVTISSISNEWLWTYIYNFVDFGYGHNTGQISYDGSTGKIRFYSTQNCDNVGIRLLLFKK